MKNKNQLVRKKPKELTALPDRSVLNPDALRCEVIPPETKTIQRLRRVMQVAYRLKWTQPGKSGEYPLMQCSEVEKCLLMMADDDEFNRFADAARLPLMEKKPESLE